jgi:magnesium transporter
MFRVVDLTAGGVQSSAGDVNVEPPSGDVVRWIDLASPTVEELDLLGERFRLHSLALEDCRRFDQRPKVEEFDDHLFLVTQSFSCNGEGLAGFELHELHTFLGKRWLITVREGTIPALEEVWERATEEPRLMRRGADFVYHQIADALVDANFPILDRIGDELEEIEDKVLVAPDRADLARIFELKRHLVRMRRVLSPQRDTMALITRQGYDWVGDRTVLYFRDVYDHLTRITESIETNRDVLGNAYDAYLSAVSNRTNEIMKHLTLLSAVFLPLAFVVGFFGQNFHDLPWLPAWQSSRVAMFGMVATCIGLPLLMTLYFRHKRWF